jgi:hypothetical protein
MPRPKPAYITPDGAYDLLIAFGREGIAFLKKKNKLNRLGRRSNYLVSKRYFFKLRDELTRYRRQEEIEINKQKALTEQQQRQLELEQKRRRQRIRQKTVAVDDNDIRSSSSTLNSSSSSFSSSTTMYSTNPSTEVLSSNNRNIAQMSNHRVRADSSMRQLEIVRFFCQHRRCQLGRKNGCQLVQKNGNT